MGATIESLGTAYTITRENLLFVAVAALVGFAGTFVVLIVGLIPFVGSFLSNLVVVPALLTFLLGMAFAGLVTGEASPGAGIDSLKANFLSLAGAYGLMYVGAIVTGVALGIVLVVFVFAGTIGGVASAMASPDAALGYELITGGVSIVFVLLFLLLLVAFFAVGIVIQFLDAAVVVGGESATSSYRAAWETVKDDPVSVLGYTSVRVGVIVAVVLLDVALYAVGSTVDARTGLALVGLEAVLVGPFVGAFLLSYHVAYYDARMGNRTEAS